MDAAEQGHAGFNLLQASRGTMERDAASCGSGYVSSYRLLRLQVEGKG